MNRYLGKKAVVISLVCFIFGWGTGAGVLPVQAETTSQGKTGQRIEDNDALTREANALFSMSIDDLMHVRIQAGTITGISENKSPVARTVITSRDIALTPARSILDLIEVYVPGATFVNHFNGPRFGIRGVLGDQNYHYLLLVNGKNMNFKAQDGALVEIFNRDLNDIREIEIIRGPGSVTYGPGAIGGIINILTHSADTRPGVNTGIELNTGYRYQTAYASYGRKGKNTDLYLYGSISRSDGEKDTDWFYVDRAHGYGYGFMSDQWGNKGLGSSPPSYLNDFMDKPQIKLYADFSFGDGWRLWGRYTSYSWEKLMEEVEYADGEDFPGFFTQGVAVSLTKKHRFSEQVSMDASLGFDSVSFREIASYQGANEPRDTITQYNNSFSENEIQGELMFHYDANDKYRFALGGVFSHEYWTPEWGKDDDTFIMSMRQPVGFGVYSSESEFYTTYGDGIATVLPHLKSDSFSVLGEANMAFHPLFHMLVSARADKSDYTDWYYSPRFALISSPTKKDTIRAVWQRSIRIPNFPEVYTMEYSGQEAPDPERLVNYELMFEHDFGKLCFNSNVFYNILDEVSWTESGGADVVGELKLFGIEAGLSYETQQDRTGINYSWTRQVAYDPKITVGADLTNPDGDAMSIENYAENRINNFPSHLVKVFWHHGWTQGIWSHVNARFAWGQNQIDLLDEFMDAHNRYGTDASRQEMNDIYDALTSHGYGKPSFTLNASVTWTLPIEPKAVLTVYGMNLISWNHVRYGIQYYETLSRQYPRQATFIKEPLTVGIKLEFNF
nr:TonB-dependent receptor [uncultured Desulfobacter sp.]